MPTALAIAAHPDDIEFVMAGTMLLLGQRDWELHCFNLADGRCGSESLDAEETAAVRAEEAQASAAALGATWHPPIGRDLELVYDVESLRRVAGVVRAVQPTIVLTHSPIDYMVDHEVACRLAVTATFARGMKNFTTIPDRPPSQAEVALYHAQPHGNRSPLREIVKPEMFVDIETVLPRKRQLLGLHRSQQGWLESSQGMSSCQASMVEMMQQLGSLSGRYRFAEGWRRHLELGLSSSGFDPLGAALADCCY